MRTKFSAAMTAVLSVLLFMAFTAGAAQDKAAEKMKKTDEMKMEKESKDGAMAMSKSEEKTGPVKSFSCDDKCGFMVRSRDEKELMSAVTSHMKKHHADMKMSTKELKGMVKTEGDEMKK